MRLLRGGAARARHDELAGGEAFGFAAAAAEEGEAVEAELFRRSERGEDVGGVSARGEGDQKIARLGERGNLARKNIVIAEIVGDAGEQRAVGGEGDGGKRAAGLGVAADELGGEVLRLGRAAAVAADEKLFP